MISDFEANFLSLTLGEVTRGNPVIDMEFTESDIEDFRSRCESDSSSNSQVRRFFERSGYSVCQSCEGISTRCDCVDSEHAEIYLLSPEAIVEDWCDHIGRLEIYEDSFIEEQKTGWKVKTISREFGVLEFNFVSDSSLIVDFDPSISSKEFLVSLVESEQVGKRDCHFMWYELLTLNDHETLLSEIRDSFTILSENICSLDSEATTNNANAIRNHIEKYLISENFERVDAQREASGVGQVLDFTDVYSAVQAGEDIVVICGCQKSSDDIHLHYTDGEEILPVSDCQPADDCATRMKDRIAKSENLRENTYEMNGRTRAVALATGLVSIGPLITIATGILNLSPENFSGEPYHLGAIVTTLLIILFLALVLPSIRMALFSWDIRSPRTRFRVWGGH
ncbi:hypothetical protein [Halomarina pelagica]|uniref:hypothetical protein n=1 Tax=Halomarina pelagica TaxID=2961599 RepID=UPI0020C46BB5|nr:hypothetical protein [Halomarina sp. BND7]